MSTEAYYLRVQLAEDRQLATWLYLYHQADFERDQHYWVVVCHQELADSGLPLSDDKRGQVARRARRRAVQRSSAVRARTGQRDSRLSPSETVATWLLAVGYREGRVVSAADYRGLIRYLDRPGETVQGDARLQS